VPGLEVLGPAPGSRIQYPLLLLLRCGESGSGRNALSENYTEKTGQKMVSHGVFVF